MQKNSLNSYLTIIHDDIKSQNVLIFKDRHGTFTPRITNFEHSTLFVNEDDFIRLSISRSWNAFENDKCSVRLCQAKKMDVFFFDILCLWVLFEKYFFRTTLFLQVAFWTNKLLTQINDSYSNEFIFKTLKHQDKLKLLVHKLLNVEVTINTKKNILNQFFTFALNYNLNKQETSFQKLIDILMSHKYDLFASLLSTSNWWINIFSKNTSPNFRTQINDLKCAQQCIWDMSLNLRF